MKEEDQIRYEELFERSHDKLVQQVMEAENCMTAHDEEMQIIEGNNAGLNIQLLELRAQVDALAEELQKYKTEMKPFRHSPPIVVGRGINDPHFYFNLYQGKSKEYVLLALMNAESMLYRYAIIRKAGNSWVAGEVS